MLLVAAAEACGDELLKHIRVVSSCAFSFAAPSYSQIKIKKQDVV